MAQKIYIGYVRVSTVDQNEARQLQALKNFGQPMHKIFIDISAKKSDNVSMDVLSMGMSDDYERAILSGANMVRIGSRLFGARIYR